MENLSEAQVEAVLTLASLEAIVKHPHSTVQGLAVFMKRLSDAGLYVTQRP